MFFLANANGIKSSLDITLQLNLAGETPMTVFGEGTMEWDETREDGTKLGSTVVQVVKAIA